MSIPNPTMEAATTTTTTHQQRLSSTATATGQREGRRVSIVDGEMMATYALHQRPRDPLVSLTTAATVVPNPLLRQPDSTSNNTKKRSADIENKSSQKINDDDNHCTQSCTKKTIHKSQKTNVVMSSYNSAFLDDLFADIARVNNVSSVDDDNEQDDAIRLHPTVSVKKSRTSMTRSISRCGKSFANLHAILSTPSLQDGLANNDRMSSSMRNSLGPAATTATTTTLHNNNSDHQLHCVSSASSDESGCGYDSRTITTTNVPEQSSSTVKLTFPMLPVTIHNNTETNITTGSANTLTRKSQPSLAPETTTTQHHYGKEGEYGWFVSMEDDDDDDNITNTLQQQQQQQQQPTLCAAATTSQPAGQTPSDLAFTAMTAPKHVNHDAEVEWARAADTVDDVLGDFF